MSIFTRVLAELYRVNHDLRVLAERLERAPWWAWRRRRRLTAMLVDGLRLVAQETRRALEEENERKVASKARVVLGDMFAASVRREHAGCRPADGDAPAVSCMYCRDDDGRRAAHDAGVEIGGGV